MDDKTWWQLVKDGRDEGWKLVWERVVEPESKSMRSAEMMERFSLTAGDLMGMLFDEMIGKHKIDLYRGEGSFEGWLKRYVRGYVLNADPNKHGEISIEGLKSKFLLIIMIGGCMHNFSRNNQDLYSLCNKL